MLLYRDGFLNSHPSWNYSLGKEGIKSEKDGDLTKPTSKSKEYGGIYIGQ